MNNTAIRIPTRRFPDFVNDGSWVNRVLGEISEIIKGEQLSKINLLEFGEYPCQNGGVNPSGFTDKFNSEENTITISEGGNSCGYVNFIGTKFWLGGHCYKLSLFSSVNKFIYHYLKSREEEIMRLRVGSGLPNIQMKSLREFPVIIPPSLSEQQKIADCLSSLDDVITAQTQKLDLLKAHKKGLMQDLFPAEGERVPRVRFGDFEGNWIEKPFGEFATFSKGKGISKSDIVANGRIRCIRYGELYTHYGEVIGDVISRTNITESDLVFSQANDVIIPSSGETSEDIATASCVLDSGIALGGDLNIIRSEVNGIFLAYYLSNAKKWQIAKLAQGNSVVHLYNNQLQRLNICLPATKEEQQKIADCLSSLDEQIQAQTQKIESLKLHKKGLMQQMFPSIQ